jgi:tRNA A-37 threonylcarbamoyl transferase component Bud32
MSGREPNPARADVRMSAPESWSALALPEHYVVNAVIGHGGMGTVLKARDSKHGRTVAIKVLRPDVAQSYGKDRFLREISTVASLVHPHIVPVLDSGAASDTLYFVMPYIEGESLRERLDHQGRLELEEAVRITREVAGALRHAHAQGIVHRDIKPENILLSRDGHAWLVDFGVARVASADLRLTQSAHIVGSPLYASPEQTLNESIDGRSDIYSLGCVLFELLTGAPPYRGESMQELLVRHHTEAPPRLSDRRADLPAAMEQVLLVSMAKRRADRYPTVAAFELALAAAVRGEFVGKTPARSRRMPGRPVWWAMGAVATGIVVIGAPLGLFSPARWARVGVPAQPVSETRYAILPFDIDSGVPALGAEDRLADALATWSGIDVVAAPPDRTQRPFDVRRGAERARLLNAGRFVFARITRKDDSLRVNVDVGDAQRSSVTLQRIRVAFPVEPAQLDRNFRDLADSLILRGLAPECVAGGPATRNLRAIRACDGAFSAHEDGELARADTLLQAALQADPQYARASLWLAEMRGWIVAAPPNTRPLLTHALANAAGLNDREQRLLRAQQHLQSAEYARACGVYRELVAADAQDYVGWLGLGECHRRDSVVVRDARSASGYSFRSSYQQAVQAYTRAFELRPSLLGGYRDRSFLAIRDLLITATTAFREGRMASSDTASFRAYPSLAGDSLQFTPLPIYEFSYGQGNSWPATLTQAVDRQRDLLRRLTTLWSRTYPASIGAVEGQAVALELAGNPEAVAVVKEGRRRATLAGDRLRLAAAEFWLSLKFGLPDDVTALTAARTLGDSLLQSAIPVDADQARQLAVIAVLLGRSGQAARLARMAAAPIASQLNLPTGLIEPARALLVFAALGTAPDSMTRLEQEFELAVENATSSRRDAIRRQFLTQAAMVAFPVHRLSHLNRLQSMSALIDAELALMRADTPTVRRIMDDWDATRSNARPIDVTIDALFVECWLNARVGSIPRAIAGLDRTLSAIRWFPPGRIDELVRAGTLMRAMELRAELATAGLDSVNARRWGNAVTVLRSSPAGKGNRSTN